jgi:hypothetical protein
LEFQRGGVKHPGRIDLNRLFAYFVTLPRRRAALPLTS